MALYAKARVNPVKKTAVTTTVKTPVKPTLKPAVKRLSATMNTGFKPKKR